MQNVLTDIEIRPFLSTDQAAAKRLILAGLADYFGEIDPTLNPDLNEIGATYKNGRFWVACHGETLIGTAAWLPEGDAMRIVRMSVARSWRRHGIGRLLLKTLISDARRLGYQQIVLETTATWKKAIAFYTACGFQPIGEADGELHFVMSLPSATIDE